MPDYEKDAFNKKNKTISLIKGIGILCLFAYMFYKSVLALPFLSPLLYFYMKMEKKECIRKQKEMLGIQFREMLSSLLAGLQAGYSMENAFMNSYNDMRLLFGENSVIARELLYIKKSLHNNQNLEDLLLDFGQRSHQQDIQDFAEVFQIAKRSGGNLPGMIRATADVIGAKMDVKRKISTIISSKKMEQTIMNFVPFGILLYINASSPGFFDPLYHNLTGILLMTALLAVYLGAYLLAERFVRIEV